MLVAGHCLFRPLSAGHFPLLAAVHLPVTSNNRSVTCWQVLSEIHWSQVLISPNFYLADNESTSFFKFTKDEGKGMIIILPEGIEW